DNLQETFGLSPIEGMAAGLPLVVSDWNGYRDTVRDGVDGFRIPTLMPPTPYGIDLADRYALGIDDYDYYIGFTSQLIAVDTAAARPVSAVRRLPERAARAGYGGFADARRDAAAGRGVPQIAARRFRDGDPAGAGRHDRGSSAARRGRLDDRGRSGRGGRTRA